MSLQTRYVIADTLRLLLPLSRSVLKIVIRENEVCQYVGIDIEDLPWTENKVVEELILLYWNSDIFYLSPLN